ncbi:FGGY family carbohydrate kinase [Cellulomonas sp. McL0617]|uniref:FGGY family carbohydrate kinase n=1 Tax=Cellulomonas sp. McL0617 TaxID=3415675 RepID=UPI003CE8C3E7
MTAPEPLVLAIDLGTTNAKAVLTTRTGSVVARGTCPVGISFPAPRWVEQDAAEIWSATLTAVAACLEAADGLVPVALAVSNQRESVVAWHRRTGVPLGPVLGWQDGRTADACARLVAQGHAELVRTRTGLTLDAMYSAPKMRWLLDAAVAQGVPAADVCLGTVDSWLVWNLTGDFATDAGNASRTLLLDLVDLDWHPELLDVFGVPRGALAEVRASDGGFGVSTDLGVLPAGLPVAAVLADSHSALYAHGSGAPGRAKVTYGTGSSVMVPCVAPDGAPDGIATTVAWLTADGPTYAREGNILSSGSALDWMATIIGTDPDRPGGAVVSGLADQVPDAGGVSLVPAFAGLGAPYWDRAATAVLTGMTAGTTRAHLARAALESVAHQVVDVVDAVATDAEIIEIVADGGATASATLMQIQADLLGRPVRTADVAEASAVGVALLAGTTLQGLPESRASAPSAGGRTVVPAIDDVQRRARRTAWRDAVARSRSTPHTI